MEMSPTVTSFRDLGVWKAGITLVLECYAIADQFPKHELFGLASQLRRAAVSVPANIAEGHERSSTKDFIRFLLIARGSLAELETHVEIGKQRRYLTSEQEQCVLRQTRQVGQMLNGLLRALRRKLDKESRGPGSEICGPRL
jgi:four helix bundle protein